MLRAAVPHVGRPCCRAHVHPPMSVRLSGVETPVGTLGVFLSRDSEVMRAGALLTAAKVKSTGY